MTVLTWDESGKNQYEMGTNHGVLYPMDATGKYGTGVSWNGLTKVTESPDGAKANDMYADNMKYASLRSAETFGATIEAYTFPDEFIPCDGGNEVSEGVVFGQQNRGKFGFCYCTEIGTDANQNAGYKLHLVYGATASPSEKSYESVNESPKGMTFSWKIDTDPAAVEGHPELKPVATITINSTKVAPDKLAALEKKLYGDTTGTPTLPLPGEVYTMFQGSSTVVPSGH